MTRARLPAVAIARALATCALAAIAACSNLPDVAADVCGNGVVEAGEDCDGASAMGTCGSTGANACHFVCAGGAACPTGYACGADQRCRAPSSSFATDKTSYAFDAIDLAAGDVDGDGIADLVGVSSDTLTARFGDSNGDLAQSTSQPVRTPVGKTVFGNLDNTGGMDVLIPNSIGVFSFLASGQGFNPYPYTSLSLDDDTDAVRAADVECVSDPFSEILALIGKTMAYINTQPKYAVCIDGGLPPACALSAHDVSDLLGDTIPTGRTGWQFGSAVPIAQDITDEFVVAFKDAAYVDVWTPTQPLMSGGSVDESTLSVTKLQTLALPTEGAFSTQLKVAEDGVAAFGNFDLDGCTDLMIPVSRKDSSGNFEAIAIAYGSKGGVTGCTGKLDPPVVVAEAEIDPTGTTAGLIPRVAADLDGDGVTDIVTNEIIAVTSCTRDKASCGSSFQLDFRSFTPREWTQAIPTDINRDGIVDLAGIVAEQDDVDVMIGGGFGFSNRFQVSTSLPPRAVRTGDFDGDLYDDVAVVVGDDTNASTEDDHLEVLFGGAAGGPSAAVDMGDFGVVQDVTPVSIFTDLESIDLITDMIVIADRDGHRGVAPLIGSSTRRLLAPYLLNEGNATDQLRDTPVAIQLGQFDGDASDYPDVVALAHLVPTQSPTGGAPTGTVDLSPRLFLLAGQGGGDLVGGQPDTPPLPESSFEYRDALWASAPLTPGSSIASVIGIDATDDHRSEVQGTEPHLFVATPTSSGADWNVVLPVALPSPYNAMRVHAVHMADLDADGAPDLVVEMAGTASAAGAAPTAMFVVWNKGGALSLSNLTAVTPTSSTCVGSEPIQADTDADLELATVCPSANGVSSTLAIFDWNGTAWTQTDASVAISGTDPRIVVGDFNGDQLDDFAIASGSGATATAEVFVQCALGDAACMTQISAAGGM